MIHLSQNPLWFGSLPYWTFNIYIYIKIKQNVLQFMKMCNVSLYIFSLAVISTIRLFMIYFESFMKDPFFWLWLLPHSFMCSNSPPYFAYVASSI